MSSKKKILITAGLGTAAVVAGVAPTIATSTNIQSSTIDANLPTDPVNPVDPVDPIEPIDPVDPIEPIDPNPETYDVAVAPSGDSFTCDMKLFSVNDSYLNSYLNSNDKEEFWKQTLQNENEYKNVKITFVKDSASFSKNTFKISVTPVDGASWKFDEKQVEPKIIDVQMKNVVAKSNDATYPVKENNIIFNNKIDITNIKSNQDLDNYFISIWENPIKLNNVQYAFTPITADYLMKNVTFEYVKGSAKLTDKSFKIKLTPNSGFAWQTTSMGNFDEPVELNVTISDGSYIADQTVGKTITLPTSWAIDWIINSRFNYKNSNSSKLIWENLSWFLDMNYEFGWYQAHKSYYLDLSATYQRYIYDGGIADLLKYFPNIESTGFNNVRWEYIQRINGGFLFNFFVQVKPKDGYYWDDKTNGVKEIKMRFFATSDKDMGSYVLGNSLIPGGIYDFVKKDKEADSALPSKYWVHNGLVVAKKVLVAGTFSENAKILHDIIKADLDICFPKWDIEVTDIWSASPWGNYDYFAPWKYNIKFTNKEDSTISKTIPGYIFTITE